MSKPIPNGLSQIGRELQDKVPQEYIQLGMEIIAGAPSPERMMSMFREASSTFKNAGGYMDGFQRDISQGEVGYNPADINAGRAYGQLAKLEQDGGLALPS